MSENTRQDKKIIHRLLENKIIAWVVVICILIIGLYKFTEALEGTRNIVSSWNSLQKQKNQEYTDTASKATRAGDVQKEKKIEEIPSQESSQHKTNIISTVIRSTVYDKEGGGLGGVEVWCTNCLNSKRVLTDSKGDFVMPASIEVQDYNIQVIEIIFKYKDQIKKVSPHYNSIHDFQTPKFAR